MLSDEKFWTSIHFNWVCLPSALITSINLNLQDRWSWQKLLAHHVIPGAKNTVLYGAYLFHASKPQKCLFKEKKKKEKKFAVCVIPVTYWRKNTGFFSASLQDVLVSQKWIICFIEVLKGSGWNQGFILPPPWGSRSVHEEISCLLTQERVRLGWRVGHSHNLIRHRTSSDIWFLIHAAQVQIVAGWMLSPCPRYGAISSALM